MKTLIRSIAAAGLALLAVGAPLSAQVTDYHDVKSPALRNFTPPEPKRIQLANGMVIFLMEDHELPLVRGSAVIRGGSREVAADKAGLVGILGQAWRTGGTTKQSGDELDQFLEARAASIETSGDDDSTAVTFDVLKGDFNTVFPIFVDLLRNPAFRQEKIDLAKTQANTGIARRNDEPDDILAREAAKLGYGANSPYTRQPEYATVASITRDDLLAFHQRFVHPNNIILGLVGDFDPATMEKQLRTAFEGWQKGPQAPAPVKDITPAKPGIYFVSKQDVTQANIEFVAPGTTKDTPDYAAIQVMNEILGGGFSGRLMNRLRSQMGLTYGIGGGIGTGWDHPGLFRIETSTKSATTLQSIDAIHKEIDALLNQPFTAEELRLAKESILNAFVFTMDSKRKVLTQRIGLEFYGYPANFYSRYPAAVQAVTAEDVAKAAKKYIAPDKVSVLVVGNEKEFEKPLSSLGAVQAIDITIPEPGARKVSGAKPTASTPDAIALASKVRDFVGGKAKVAAVQSMRKVAQMTMRQGGNDMQMDVDSLTRYPDSQRVTLKLPMGEMTMVATPSAGFVLSPMGVQDLPGSQRESMVSEVRTDLVYVLQNIENPKFVFAIDGTEKVDGVEASVLSVDVNGQTVKWIVDPSSGRILQERQNARGPQPGEQVVEHADWKSFGGIMVPTTSTMLRNGEKAGEVKVSNIEINPAIDAKAFEKPAGK